MWNFLKKQTNKLKQKQSHRNRDQSKRMVTGREQADGRKGEEECSDIVIRLPSDR